MAAQLCNNVGYLTSIQSSQVWDEEFRFDASICAVAPDFRQSIKEDQKTNKWWPWGVKNTRISQRHKNVTNSSSELMSRVFPCHDKLARVLLDNRTEPRHSHGAVIFFCGTLKTWHFYGRKLGVTLEFHHHLKLSTSITSDAFCILFYSLTPVWAQLRFDRIN